MNAPVTPQVDFNTRVAQYVKLRDKIKELNDAHKKLVEPYNEALEKLNGILLDHLNQVGADSVSSSSGNVHRTEKKSASVADKGAFWTWVVTQAQWDFLDWKANVTAVDDFIKAQAEAAKTDPTITPSPPPGVNFTSRYVVGVRRGGT